MRNIRNISGFYDALNNETFKKIYEKNRLEQKNNFIKHN